MNTTDDVLYWITTSRNPEEQLFRFWSQVRLGAEDDCWPWKSTHKNEYAKFGVGVITVDSHVVAFALINGRIKDGNHVLHTCDFKPCCNYHHLYAGTQRRNTEDAIERKALVTTCITLTTVQKAVDEYLEGIYTQAEIGKKYGVSGVTVGRWASGARRSIRFKDGSYA